MTRPELKRIGTSKEGRENKKKRKQHCSSRSSISNPYVTRSGYSNIRNPYAKSYSRVMNPYLLHQFKWLILHFIFWYCCCWWCHHYINNIIPFVVTQLYHHYSLGFNFGFGFGFEVGRDTCTQLPSTWRQFLITQTSAAASTLATAKAAATNKYPVHSCKCAFHHHQT